MPLSPNSSLFLKNNTRNIKEMVALIFSKWFDSRKMPILGRVLDFACSIASARIPARSSPSVSFCSVRRD
jgi:hypothetical protein